MQRFYVKAASFLFFLQGLAFAQGTTWIVDVNNGPGTNFTEIKPAITAAVSGDTILVRDGIYKGLKNTNLTFNGKLLTLRSENGPQNCIIDGEGFNRGIRFISGETSAAKLQGFTIRNGKIGPDGGGGISCTSSDPLIENCIVENCKTISSSFQKGGGGIQLIFSKAIIRNCIVRGNQAISSFAGGGLYSLGGSAQLINCLFVNNAADVYGGAIFSESGALTVLNCTITGNTTAWAAPGISLYNTVQDVIRNCVIWGNPDSGMFTPSQVLNSNGSGLIDHCIIEGGQNGIVGFGALVLGPGIFGTDPHFLDTGEGSYDLEFDSPCIDAGSNELFPSDIYSDLVGNPRFVDDASQCDSGEGLGLPIDIGAYEFQASQLPWAGWGNALEGSDGKPCLMGTGSLFPGTPVTLTLSNAPANSPTYLILGYSNLSAPFKGGVLVPFPNAVIPLLTNLYGQVNLSSPWPPGIPGAVTVYFQVYIPHPTGPEGFIASNAISLTTPFASSQDDLKTQTVYSYQGSAPSSKLGRSVAFVGDLNGDGYDEFLVGTPGTANSQNTEAGTVTLYSGSNGVKLFERKGTKFYEHVGNRVSAIGDVNGDGTRDFMYAAEGGPSGKQGYVKVFSGINFSELYTLTGGPNNLFFGDAIAAAGDVNGDGYADLLIGDFSDTTNGSSAGAAFVYSGNDGALLKSFHGDALSSFGASLGGLGDINHDGYDDFIVGIPYADGAKQNIGAAKVYSGFDGALLFTKTGTKAADYLGQAVVGTGDVNGDATPDFAVGIPGDDEAGINSGRVQVFSGQDGELLYQMSGEETSNFFGGALSGNVDLNGDSVPDLLVGASQKNPGGSLPIDKPGYAAIFSGIDGKKLLLVTGASNQDLFGSALSATAKGNGSLGKILIGAPADSSQSSGGGKVVLYSLFFNQ